MQSPQEKTETRGVSQQVLLAWRVSLVLIHYTHASSNPPHRIHRIIQPDHALYYVCKRASDSKGCGEFQVTPDASLRKQVHRGQQGDPGFFAPSSFSPYPSSLILSHSCVEHTRAKSEILRGAESAVETNNSPGGTKSGTGWPPASSTPQQRMYRDL